MSNINSFLRDQGIDPLPHLTIIDVGAMEISGDPWDPLVATGMASVIGFEPIRAEWEKLQQRSSNGRRYLPFALGDGETWPFHLCRAPFTSSLLPPNTELIKHFDMLAELCTVVSVSDMETKRLDDIDEIDAVDFIKLDTQGSELTILSNAERTLKSCVACQVEVSFVPIYQDQPLFADIDNFMRQRGFLLHRFTYQGSRSFRHPPGIKTAVGDQSQWLWSDAIYVRDFTELDSLEPESLLKIAVLAHSVFKSHDLALFAFQALDRQRSSTIAASYYDASRLKMVA